MARRAHRSSILSSSRTPDQLRVPRSEHLVHFSRRRCFEHNQRPEHLTCRRPRLDVARRAHPWPGTWCTYRRSQYERYSLAVTSDGKVGPSGVGVCSRISAALSCDTVKTRFSGSGGAGRSPARKFYGQALFSRQNLHAIRPTAPRWIALIETCTKHAKQGECGAARGLQERTCLRNAVATAMDVRSCGSSRPA